MERHTSIVLREVVREALYGLYHHRFRAALSMLGISWASSRSSSCWYGDGRGARRGFREPSRMARSSSGRVKRASNRRRACR